MGDGMPAQATRIGAGWTTPTPLLPRMAAEIRRPPARAGARRRGSTRHGSIQGLALIQRRRPAAPQDPPA